MNKNTKLKHNLIIVTELIALWFAFMRANYSLEFMFAQNVVSYIWTKVASSTSKCVVMATMLSSWVTPQNV